MMAVEQYRQETAHLLNPREVKDYLGVSYRVLAGLVQRGELRAFKVTGEPVSREFMGDQTFGLRFYPEDVKEFLDNRIVR